MLELSKNTYITADSGKLIKLLCITWVITKLICYKLWLSDRLFPIIPVHDSLAILPSLVHMVLFIASLGSMLFLIIFPGKKAAVVLLIAEILSCMLDQNRWQPWEYQFIFMLVVYLYDKDEKRIRFSWQLIIAGIFFFSGISKLNSGFIHDVWQGLLLRRWLGIFPVTEWISRVGYALPFIEMVAAICLLVGKTRRIAVRVLIAMHAIILLMLGPVGLDTNAVIWPWNILMPVLLFFLFYKNSFEYGYSFFRKPLAWLVILCWWILPWLQLAGYWDKYLSSVLYSGGVEQLFICTSHVEALKEMNRFTDKEFKVIPCSPVLSVYKWGVSEMKTAPYPEKRIYKAIIKAWREKYPAKTDKFYLYKPGFAYTVKEVLAP